MPPDGETGKLFHKIDFSSSRDRGMLPDIFRGYVDVTTVAQIIKIEPSDKKANDYHFIKDENPV